MSSLKTIEINSLLDRITRIRQQTGGSFLTNYFGNLHSNGPYPVVETDDALFFLDADRDFHHLLFAATSPESLNKVLQNCPPGIYAADYLTKSFDQNWENAFLLNGFSRRAVYHRIASTFPKIPSVTSAPEFARIDEAEFLHQRLPEVFDRYLHHLPSLEQTREMIQDRRVLVNRNAAGEIAGFFVYEVKGQRSHLNYWYSPPELGPNAGLEILIRGYHEMVQRGVKFVHGWVNETNVKVLRIHRLFGLVPDGLIHYIYHRNDYAQSL